MKKFDLKKQKSIGLIGLTLLACLLVFAACDFLFPKKDKEDPVEEVYQPKEVSGTIALPTGSTLDVSKCTVQSVYGDAVITGNSFSMKVESATVQQMIYFTNAKKDILMAGFINSNEANPALNSETTTLAVIMLLLQAGGSDQAEWDKLVTKVKASSKFPNIKAKVEALIKSEKDIFSETNTDLITACVDFIKDISVTLKNASVDKDISPLVVTSAGNKVSITNNGKAPLYQITMKKDGAQVDQQSLLAADPVKMSIGNILTWKWGVCSPPDPIEFTLSKTGDYEFRASSWDADPLLLSPRFNNAVLVTNQLLCTFGFPLSNACAKETANFMYNLMVSTVISIRTANKDVNDAIRVFLDFMVLKASAFTEMIAKCATETNPAKLGEYTEKFVKAAKFGLKCFDVLGKAESGITSASLLGLWAYQPTEITFCKHYENDLLLSCGTGFFNAVTCNLHNSNGKNFINYKMNWGGTTYDSWSSNYFNIGTTFKPVTCTITPTNFRIEGKSPTNADHKFSVTGTIKDLIITDITLTELQNEYTGGVLEYSTSKQLILTNLSISLNDISSTGYNTVDYFKNSSAKIVSITDTYKYWDKKNSKMIVNREVVGNIISSVFDLDGKIQISFSTVK
jgi:hypothetical protein